MAADGGRGRLTGGQLDGALIRALLGEVADRLGPGGPQHLVVVAGGSLLAWHGLRDSTRDVDSLRRLDPELVTAADEVGAAHGLAPGWLNAHAAGSPQPRWIWMRALC